MRFLVLNPEAERRDGLKALLRQIDRQAGFNDAQDWLQARHLLKQQSFSLIAIDWQDTQNIADLRTLCAACAPTPVAILVDEAPPAFARTLFDAGVFGVIPRATRPELLILALESVLLGGYFIPPAALNLQVLSSPAHTARIQAFVQQRPKRKSPRGTLSPRQTQIMRFVHMGNTNKMIAKTLGISEGTVKIHLASIFQQLGAPNRAAAVALYNGWLPAHLEVLLSTQDGTPKPILGAPCPVPLRAPPAYTKYALMPVSEQLSHQPMAAEPPGPFKPGC